MYVKAKLLRGANLMHTDKHQHFASASSSYLCGFVCMLQRQSLRCACFPAALITSQERYERETLRTKQHTHTYV
jgi:hypothetical protein